MAEQVLPIVEERLDVHTQRSVTGGVRVHITSVDRTETVETDLRRETASVETVEINRPVDTAPETRMEGDLLIIPVCEEVATVVKQLMLVREIRVRRSVESVTARQPVVLRSEQVRIERLEADPSDIDTLPPTPEKEPQNG